MKNKYGSDNGYEQEIEAWKKMPPEKQNETIQNPGHVDEGVWDKAKKAAAESGHAEKWPLVMFLYEKMGGK